jgi:hypothetical protein
MSRRSNIILIVIVVFFMGALVWFGKKNKRDELIRHIPKRELSIQEILSGNYLRNNSTQENFIVLTTDNKYYSKIFKDEEEVQSKSGNWKIIELSTKSLTNKRTASFILFDNEYILQIFDKCFGLPKAPFGDIAWKKGYRPAESEFLMSMNLSAPFNISRYKSECIKPTLQYNDLFKSIFKDLYAKNNQVSKSDNLIQSNEELTKQAEINTALQSNTDYQTAVINVDNLNFRSTPEISDNIIGKLKINEKIIYLESISINKTEVTKGTLNKIINIDQDGKKFTFNKYKAINILGPNGDYELAVSIPLGNGKDLNTSILLDDIDLIKKEVWAKIEQGSKTGYVYYKFLNFDFN